MYSFVSLTWPATAVAMGKRKADDSKEKEEPEKEVESEEKEDKSKAASPKKSATPKKPKGKQHTPRKNVKGKEKILKNKAKEAKVKAKAVQKKPASGSKGTNNTDQPEEVKKKQEDLREKTEKWKQGLGEEGLSWALSLLPFVSQIIKIRISHLSVSARQSQCKRGLSSVFRKYLLSNIGWINKKERILTWKDYICQDTSKDVCQEIKHQCSVTWS